MTTAPKRRRPFPRQAQVSGQAAGEAELSVAGDGWVGPGRSAAGVSIPVTVTIFPSEQYQAPRSRAERAYPGLIYFNEVDRGGHFAA